MTRAPTFLPILQSLHGILVAEGAPYFAAAYLHEGFWLCIDGLDLSVCGKSTIGTLVLQRSSSFDYGAYLFG